MWQLQMADIQDTCRDLFSIGSLGASTLLAYGKRVSVEGQVYDRRRYAFIVFHLVYAQFDFVYIKRGFNLPFLAFQYTNCITNFILYCRSTLPAVFWQWSLKWPLTNCPSSTVCSFSGEERGAQQGSGRVQLVLNQTLTAFIRPNLKQYTLIISGLVAFTQHCGSSHLLHKDVKQTMYCSIDYRASISVWDHSFMGKESNVSLLAGRPAVVHYHAGCLLREECRSGSVFCFLCPF